MEQIVGQSRHPSEAVGTLRPVVCRQDGWDRDGLNVLPLRDQLRVVIRGETGGQIEAEILERHWQQFEPLRPFLLERLDRLRGDEHHRLHVIRASPHLCQSYLMRDVGLVYIEFQLVEDDRPGIRGSRAFSVEVDLLAAQIVQRVDLRSHEYMQLGRKQAEDVRDALRDVGDLALKLYQGVGIDDGNIYPFEIQQVFDVLSRAACHD